jgi:hypothetical protein
MGKPATIALKKIRNPNVEIPAYRQAGETMTKIRITNDQTRSLRCDASDLEHLKFGFVSNFVLRYSNFHPFDTQTTEELMCPLRIWGTVSS